MPKFRCHLPKKEGDEASAEAKQTKDGWDATFVFDGPAAPKGMVCKVVAPKAQPRTAVGIELPKAVTIPTAEAVTPTAAAVTEPPKAASDTVPPAAGTEAETVAVVEVPAGRPADFPSPAGTQSVSNPSGGAAEFVALAAATAVAGALLSSAFANPANAKAKGKHGKQGKHSSQQDQRKQLDQRRREKEEKERKDCGASTEAVKADAQRDEQKFDVVLASVSRLLQRLGELDENPTNDLAGSINALAKRISRLEARQQVSSKRDSEPRTARRRQPKPDPHEKQDVGKAPRPRRT